MSWREIIRHTSFRKNKTSWEVQSENGFDYVVANVDTPAHADVPVAYQTIGRFTDLVGPDPTINVVASGVPFSVNGMPYVTFRDSEADAAGATAVSATGARGLWLLIDPADEANIAAGKPAYMIPDATASTGGCLTTAPNGTTNMKFGRFLSDEVKTATGERNALATGKWAFVQKLDIF